WLKLSRKQDRLNPEVGALPTPSSILAVCQHLTATSKERKSYATCDPLPKPVALPQELQTRSSHSNPTGTEAELRVTPDACRSSKQNVVMNTETQSRTMANVAFLD